MAATDETNEENLSPETVMTRFVAERGDIFEEFHLMARELPATVNLVRRTAGYVHFYENQTTADQDLSGPMRELIALCQLCAKGDDRFAPNHVRRLYRMGVTNRAMFEAAAVNAPPYPAEPILMIVPLQAGSAGDVMMRIVAQKMSENLGPQIVIEKMKSPLLRSRGRGQRTL